MSLRNLSNDEFRDWLEHELWKARLDGRKVEVDIVGEACSRLDELMLKLEDIKRIADDEYY